jgi:hypothetical protein
MYARRAQSAPPDERQVNDLRANSPQNCTRIREAKEPDLHVRIGFAATWESLKDASQAWNNGERACRDAHERALR